jgi:hypothetical protein
VLTFAPEIVGVGLTNRIPAAQALLALFPQEFTATTQYWYAVPATALTSLYGLVTPMNVVTTVPHTVPRTTL